MGGLGLLPGLLVSSILVVPKLLLIEFSRRRLGARRGLRASLNALSQDLLLASLIFLALEALLRGSTLACVLAGAPITAVLLLILLLDCRVRQLWQRPTDLALLRYSVANRKGVSSGRAVFFGLDGGWGLSFGGALAASEIALVLAWVAGSVVRVEATIPMSIRIAFPAALFLLAVLGPRERHRIEENILVEPVLRWFRRARLDVGAPPCPDATFEQRPRLLASVLGNRPRHIASDARPFQNVAIVVLESVRWRGLGLMGDGPIVMPTLRRLGREGLLARCYVSVPHTSKSLFTILTGRHAPPGIEIRESGAARHESLLWALRETRRMSTFCFSSQYLDFENTDDLLTALGVERQIETCRLAPETGARAISGTSFGSSDAALVELPPQILARREQPFAAVLLTLAAHYPYLYPDKANADGDGIDSYWRCIASADGQIARLLESFEKADRLDDTLFVILGDHGESFGEHGMFLHNNSMYEEEVATPLVLWSADGRIRSDSPIVARQIDVAPTLADLLGVRKAPLSVAGESLLRKDSVGTVYAASYFDGVARAMLLDGTKYIHLPPSGEILAFDLQRDPDEVRPVSVEDVDRRREILCRLDSFDRSRAWPEPVR